MSVRLDGGRETRQDGNPKLRIKFLGVCCRVANSHRCAGIRKRPEAKQEWEEHSTPALRPTGLGTRSTIRVPWSLRQQAQTSVGPARGRAVAMSVRFDGPCELGGMGTRRYAPGS